MSGSAVLPGSGRGVSVSMVVTTSIGPASSCPGGRPRTYASVGYATVSSVCGRATEPRRLDCGALGTRVPAGRRTAFRQAAGPASDRLLGLDHLAPLGGEPQDGVVALDLPDAHPHPLAVEGADHRPARGGLAGEGCRPAAELQPV